MAVLNILKYPHPHLRLCAHSVRDIDLGIQQLCQDMLETMYSAQGIGLAATQVDILKRVVVIDLSDSNVAGKYEYNNINSQQPLDLSRPLFLINPEIDIVDDTLVPYEEGCLSIPDFNAVVKRPNKIFLRSQTLQGTIEIEATGLLATCLQHEIDHLDGKLFVDHLSTLKMQQVRRKFKLK